MSFAEIQENFRFLTLKIMKQVEDTRAAFSGPFEGLAESFEARDDYIDNLKTLIHNKCYRLLGDERIDRQRVNHLRAFITATTNLERIGDFAVNIVGQLGYLSDRALPERFGPDPFFDAIGRALGQVNDALVGRDLAKGLAICRTEFAVDELYARCFRQIMDALRAGEPPEDLVTSLFLYRYLERMGDEALNIGEAVIFAAVGERLKVQDFQALERTLGSADFDVELSEIDYEGIWGTRSGCRIGAVRARPSDQRGEASKHWVVFKEGSRGKVQAERDALARWERLAPGLTPRVFGYHEQDDKAAILLEYVWGTTLQRLIMEGEPEAFKRGFVRVLETLSSVWTGTLEHGLVRPRFLAQLARRLPDVLNIHPEFAYPRSRVGGVAIASFDDLLEAARPIDEALCAPFSVLIHGDFNIDNIIVDSGGQGGEDGAAEGADQDGAEVHFIDLHRTQRSDYAQDVSVFVVSCFRMPVSDPPLRARLGRAALELYRFARGFGAQHGDGAFHARLALGLARSLITSTRFEVTGELAKTMFNRAVYLIERLIEHQGAPWEDFTLPEAAMTP